MANNDHFKYVDTSVGNNVIIGKNDVYINKKNACGCTQQTPAPVRKKSWFGSFLKFVFTLFTIVGTLFGIGIQTGHINVNIDINFINNWGDGDQTVVVNNVDVHLAFDENEAVQTLSDYAQSDKWTERYGAIWALKHINSLSAKLLVQAAKDDDNEMVRGLAHECFILTGSPMDEICKKLASDSKTDRSYAAWALWRIGVKSEMAIAALRQQIAVETNEPAKKLMERALLAVSPNH